MDYYLDPLFYSHPESDVIPAVSNILFNLIEPVVFFSDLIPSVQGEVLSSNRLIAFIVGGTLGGVLLIGTLAAFLSYYFG